MFHGHKQMNFSFHNKTKISQFGSLVFVKTDKYVDPI